jgi:hypothetical protein
MTAKLSLPSLQVWINQGTASEPSHRRGLAHLAEHMIFRSRDPETGELLVNSLYKRKIKINAYTSYNYTVFILSGQKALDAEVLTLMKKMLLSPCFSSDDLEKEKKVILNEIEESNGKIKLSIMKFFKHMESKYWGYDLLGDDKTVQKAKNSDVLNYYKQTFVPKNMTFVSSRDSLPIFKSTHPNQAIFKKNLQSPYMHFDTENNFGHGLLKINNFRQYAVILLLQDYLHANGIRCAVIVNRQVQIVILSRFNHELTDDYLLQVVKSFDEESFNKKRLNLTLAFLRDRETGNNLFHEAEWQQEFVDSGNFYDFQTSIMDIKYKEFRQTAFKILNPVALNSAFNAKAPARIKKVAHDKSSLFCFSLIIPYGYLSESKKLTGFTFTISEFLASKFQEKFKDHKVRINSEFSHDHYGVTIWGLGDKLKTEGLAYKFLKQIDMDEAEASELATQINYKISNLRTNEKFEIESDQSFFKPLAVNSSRYPAQILTGKKLFNMLTHHKALLKEKVFRTGKRVEADSNKKPQSSKKKKTGHNLYLNKQGEKAEYLVYLELPQRFNSFEHILSISAYVNREEFALYNKLKYEMGFLYSFKVKIQKIKGSFYLKLKFTSSEQNEDHIRKLLDNFDLDQELQSSLGYYHSSNDVFSKNRELLLRNILSN